VVRCLLIEPNPESALNEEAGRLFMEDYESYARRARLMTNIHAIKEPAAAGSATSHEAYSSSLPQTAAGSSTEAATTGEHGGRREGDEGREGAGEEGEENESPKKIAKSSAVAKNGDVKSNSKANDTKRGLRRL